MDYVFSTKALWCPFLLWWRRAYRWSGEEDGETVCLSLMENSVSSSILIMETQSDHVYFALAVYQILVTLNNHLCVANCGQGDERNEATQLLCSYGTHKSEQKMKNLKIELHAL